MQLELYLSRPAAAAALSFAGGSPPSGGAGLPCCGRVREEEAAPSAGKGHPAGAFPWRPGLCVRLCSQGLRLPADRAVKAPSAGPPRPPRAPQPLGMLPAAPRCFFGSSSGFLSVSCFLSDPGLAGTLNQPLRTVSCFLGLFWLRLICSKPACQLFPPSSLRPAVDSSFLPSSAPTCTSESIFAALL